MRTLTSMRGGLWVGLALMTAGAACAPNSNVGNDYKPGQTEFVTVEPGGGNFRGGAESDASGGAPQAAPTTGDQNAAPSGRTGTVEEADIYRIDQNRLFYFSTYRGFIIYDLNDPAHPTQISRLPVYGYPVEMFVDGTTVYALIRDALYLTQGAAGTQYERHDVSQLLAIDVSDVTNPKLLKSIDIVGQLREGVSRKIDDTIYVVSYIPQGYYGWGFWNWGWYGDIDTEKEQAWVYSFNVANAADPQLVDKLKIFEGGSFNASTNNSYSGRYFQGIALSATANTLHVVENWQTYGSVYGSPYNCGSYQSQQQAVVSIVDISNPTGAIRLHSTFETYGQLTDQFKQTYIYDDVTHQGHYYGIFARQEWSSSNCQGSSVIKNTLESWNVTDGANPTKVDSLAFGKPNETVGGTLFDPARKVAFAITAERVDPFYALSIADPANLTVLSSVDNLAGDMSVFRFIGQDNKFILGIGRDNTAECTGFVNNTTRFRTGIAVSIFDVQNLAATRLVQRKCVDVDGADWVSSEITWNLDQAHKMLGMHSDATKNLVSVPVSYYKRNDEQNWWWYRYQSAVGLLSWDLAAYNPNLSELQQTVLKTHATVEHPDGGVRRSILFTHAGDNRRTMVNLSDTTVSVFDLEDVDAPVAKANIEVAPNVEALFRFGGHLVEHVRAEGGGYGYDTASEFRIKPVGGNIDETAKVASFTVGQVQRVMKWKDALVIFRALPDTNNSPYYYGNGASQIVIYDLADPANPTLRSTTDLPWSIYPNYYFWCGDIGYFGGWWWSGATQWASIDSGLAFASNTYNYQNNTSEARIVYVNLSDLAAPVVKNHSLAQGDQQILTLTTDATDPSAFFLTYRDQIGIIPGPYGYQLTAFKYYAQRWSPTGDDIGADAATNLPGQIVRSWKSGDKTYLVTQNNRYNWVSMNNGGYWDTDPRLHLLERLNNSTAALRDSTTLDNRGLNSLVGSGDRLFVTTSKVNYGGYYGDTPVSSGSGGDVARSGLTQAETEEDPSDRLSIFDVSGGTFATPFDGSLGLRGTQVMGAQGNRLFMNVASAGVLVLDVSDSTAPLGNSFLRTLGWGSHLEFSGSTLYVAAGNFGVFQQTLGAGSLAP